MTLRVQFRHNDRERILEVDPRDRLHQHLSDERDREGACLNGRCMRCCVLLGGRVVPACQIPIFRVHGLLVQDLDGLSHDSLFRDITRAFEKIGVNRCGEALPALMMLAYQLLSEVTIPSDSELAELSRHITSRCISRDEFERATRLAGRVQKRRRNEHSR